MPQYYGIFVNLKGKSCAVFGGDEHEGERKVSYLNECGANVVLYSPEDDTSLKLKVMAKQGLIKWIKRTYQSGDLEKITLAIVADTSSESTNKAIFEEAEQRNVLLNIMDVTDLCTFIAPALVHKEPVVTAISTSGASPALARKLREEMSSNRCACMQWTEATKSLVNIRKRIRSQGIVVCPEKWQWFMTPEWLEIATSKDFGEAENTLFYKLKEQHCISCEPFGRCMQLAKKPST